jgi:hypothetical protein
MAELVKIRLEGQAELLELFRAFQSDFGQKDTKKILVNSARTAMQTVLRVARRTAPDDTGELRRSLIATARRVTSRDRKSKYYKGESIVAFVSTAPFKKIVAQRIKHIKKQAKKEGRSISTEEQERASTARFGARAIATEFGTFGKSGARHNQPQKWLTRSYDATYQTVANELGRIIGNKMMAYRAKKTNPQYS